MRVLGSMVLLTLCVGAPLDAQVLSVAPSEVSVARRHQECGGQELQSDSGLLKGKRAEIVSALRAEREDEGNAVHLAGVFGRLQVREVTANYVHLAGRTERGSTFDYCLSLNYVTSIVAPRPAGELMLALREGFIPRAQGKPPYGAYVDGIYVASSAGTTPVSTPVINPWQVGTRRSADGTWYYHIPNDEKNGVTGPPSVPRTFYPY